MKLLNKLEEQKMLRVKKNKSTVNIIRLLKKLFQTKEKFLEKQKIFFNLNKVWDKKLTSTSSLSKEKTVLDTRYNYHITYNCL